MDGCHRILQLRQILQSRLGKMRPDFGVFDPIFIAWKSQEQFVPFAHFSLDKS